MRQRHLRSALGFAWFFITPVAIFLLYWFIFGRAFSVTWQDPGSGRVIGYIAPFAIGYALFLFLSNVVGGSTTALARVSSLVRRGGVPIGVATASFVIEFVLNLTLYLIIAMVLVAANVPYVSPIGAGVFTLALLLFVVQALALGVILMFVTPFIDDFAEGARLALRLFVYAAGVTVPLTMWPATVRDFAVAAPLSGPLNGAREGLMFAVVPSPASWALWSASAAVLSALAAVAYVRLRQAALETL